MFILIPLVILGCGTLPSGLLTPSTAPSVVAPEPFDASAVGRIRDEGLNRSQVMQTLSYLTDVIGPRLTGSPNLKRANEWTRDTLAGWGLANAHLEPWGPFGRGWSLQRFSAEVVEPQVFPLIAYPKAWSPGLPAPITAEVVHLDPASEEDMRAGYAGKLEGKIILIGSEQQIDARFQPLAVRYPDDELDRLADAEPGTARSPLAPLPGAGPILWTIPQPTTGPASRPESDRPNNAALLTFAFREKAALIVTPSPGDGGTMFVQSAAAVGSAVRNFTGPRVWAADAPDLPPQIAVTGEHYNRLLRMLDAGETVRMAVNLEAEYHSEDLMAYNTIAEIPGTDLKDEIVMLGGHLDSWHTGTGATDNGAGVAAAMEAVRIIQALGLKPRRTIRIALWTGEEQGLYGSAAYVREHFGRSTGRGRGGRGRGGRRGGNGPASAPTTARAPQIIKGPEYDQLSAYFNLDNGTGRIRGIYLQGDAAAREIFQNWLAPFEDLGATTVSVLSTVGTDHQSFDGIGLPAFQFIQDQIEYGTRTHHSNQDVFDRIQKDDMEQASVILATFVYNAAMMDGMIPRK